MNKYQEFLEKICVISEDQFDKIVDEFPDVEIDDLDISEYDDNTFDDIVRAFVNALLDEYDCVWIDDLDFDNKTISIEDVQSLKDLESIKNKLFNWNITNYNELKGDLLQEEEENRKDMEHLKKMNLITDVIDNIPFEDIENFIKNYANKK